MILHGSPNHRFVRAHGGVHWHPDHTFITAEELKSLTKTANKLYVSQPAVSHAIKKLEEELGMKLFMRNKRSNLTLTDVGKDILTLAYQMVDLENRLYQRAYEENHLMAALSVSLPCP